MLCTSEYLTQLLARSERVWLFLDYDGSHSLGLV